MRLQGQLVQVGAISSQQRETMFALMQRYYDNISRHTFESDLAEKQWVILLRDRADESIRGFSTQMLLNSKLGGQTITALFSGDTIVERECWGDAALSHVWGRLALSLIDTMPDEPLYWFLISKGYRTYRFLPVFFHEFYPRYDAPTPVVMRQAMDAIAIGKFGSLYDAARGIVRSHCGKDRLRSGIGHLTVQRLRDPHVRFFAQRNPHYADGEELCCVAPLTRANFTAAAYRVIHAGAS